MMKYKSCYVPGCPNSTVCSPGKVFLSVPNNPKERQRWMKAVKRDMENAAVSPKTKLFCCEDHFDLEKDMLSWRKFKFLREGGLRTQALLKPGIVPHVFPHQVSHEEDLPATVEDIKVEPDLPTPECFDFPLPMVDETTVKEEPLDIQYENGLAQALGQLPQPKKEKFDKGVQAVCRSPSCSTGVQADLDYFERRVDSSCQATLDLGSNESLDKSVFSNLNWEVPDEQDFQERSLNVTMRRIKKNPMIYIGISPRNMGFINSISVNSGCSPGNVLLTLNKLAMNLDFETLGENFGLSTNQASLIFRDTLTKLADNMKDFINWPKKLRARKLLLPDNAISMIQCLEIKIEKPDEPRLQALTWSKNYHVNTCKYLVSCSPDGTFNFVSRGYSGRAADTNIAVDSGFVNHLPCGAKVMIFGGFKNLDKALLEKQVELVTPPEVKCKAKLSKEEVREARRNVRLVWNAGRLIARLRTFSFLALETYVEDSLVTLLDSAVVVVSALLNQDDPLIL